MGEVLEDEDLEDEELFEEDEVLEADELLEEEDLEAKRYKGPRARTL